MSKPFSKLQKKNTSGAGADGNLKQTRRRLSVVSDNKLVEGLSGLATEDDNGEAGSGGGTWIESYAGVSKKGYAPYNPRKKNQDVLIMEKDDKTDSLLLCVFDGHGEAGDGVSQFFKAQLPPTLFAHPEFQNSGVDEKTGLTGIETALAESIQFLEKNLLRDSSIDTEFSGTTAVMSVTRGNHITVANIGDSRITLGFKDSSSKVHALNISDDHKPDRPNEKARIISKGGRVFAVEYDDGIDGPFRVWLGHMDVPGLAMSRSLGDTVAHSAGVLSTPEFTSYKLGEGTGRLVHSSGEIMDQNVADVVGDACSGYSEDAYLVIASDGLWEFMTDQEVIDICDSQTECRRTVDLLIMEANGRWMKEEQVIDDTTVIVAHVKKPSS